jgi:hypothetical protein
LVTDAEGSFWAVFTVPALAPQGWLVAATVFDTTVSTSFTVTPSVTEAPAPTAATQLASISDVLIRVWTYDARNGWWLMYDPADMPGSNLERLWAGHGYWVEVSEDRKLIYGGNFIWHQLDLTAGRNLIGWR